MHIDLQLKNRRSPMYTPQLTLGLAAILRSLHACVDQKDPEAAYALLQEAKVLEKQHQLKANMPGR